MQVKEKFGLFIVHCGLKFTAQIIFLPDIFNDVPDTEWKWGHWGNLAITAGVKTAFKK